MCAQKWRGFAGDFAPGEVRYDEFVAGDSTAADAGANRPAATAGSKAVHPALVTKTSELLNGVQDKEQRMAALRKHILEEQKKQQRRDERRRQRLQEEAEEWHRKHQEQQEKAKEEREKTLQKLAIAKTKSMQKLSKVHDSTTIEPSTTLGESTMEGDETSFFLTGVGDSEMPIIPPEYKDRIRLPPMPKFAKFKVKNSGLPRKAAIPHFKRKDGGKKKDGSVKLPRLTDDDGKLSSVIPNPEEPTMPVKENLRKAQAKMLKQLSGSVSFYRAHMRKHFQRILEVSELQFGDTTTRRKQAAWNLAKPLSITEIKQMAAAKIQQ